MPIYYFNVHQDNVLKINDKEGTELSDLRAAIAFAVLCARSHAADDVLRGQLRSDDMIEIADAKGSALHMVRFDEAIGLCSLDSIYFGPVETVPPKKAAAGRPAHSGRHDAAFADAARSDAGLNGKAPSSKRH